jgi:hypothetical protein
MGKMMNVMGWMGMAAAIVIAGAAPARADERIVTKVPFDFIAADTRFPAGDYVIMETSYPDVVSIESADGRHFAFLLTIPDGADKELANPELVFAQFGGEHFLARIAAVDGEGHEIPLTPASLERELKKVEEPIHQHAMR